jgi:ABC-type cobalamin transport system ATPase subunit
MFFDEGAENRTSTARGSLLRAVGAYEADSGTVSTNIQTHSACRDRLLCALKHEEPDRVPVDFGGTSVTGMHVSCVAALREYFGLARKPVKVIDVFQMLGEVEEDLKTALGVDTEPVLARKTKFGFPNEG